MAVTAVKHIQRPFEFFQRIRHLLRLGMVGVHKESKKESEGSSAFYGQTAAGTLPSP